MTRQIKGLPSTWKVVPLSEATSKIVDGSHNPPRKQDTGLPMISARNIENNRIVFNKYRYISQKDFRQEQKRTRITPGDVLLTIVGTIGRSAVVADGERDFTLQRSVAAVTPKDMLPKYLMYQLQAPFIQRHFEEVARGTAQKGVYLKTLGETSIRVAPAHEQEQIVAEIEKQFSRLDEAVANLKRVKANLKRYKAAVLKAAVEGKLTEEWRKEHPDVEPASELLKRILAERRRKWEETQLAKMRAKGKEPKDDRWKKKYKEPSGIKATNLPPIPKGWHWITIDQITLRVTDGEHISPKARSAGIPLLSAKDVRDNRILFNESKYVSEVDADKFRLRCNPEKGDVLIVSRGATIGRSCCVDTDTTFCLMGSVILIKLHKQMESSYVLMALKSPKAKKLLFGVSGSTAQQAIYIRDIRSLPIPLPPPIEQDQITVELDRIFSFSDNTLSVAEEAFRRIERLRQSILNKAFSGELLHIKAKKISFSEC